MVLCSPLQCFWFKKIILMAFLFSVAFSSIFVYLHQSYATSTLTALAVAGPLAAVTGLGVTFSIFFRAAVSVMFVSILQGFGRLLLIICASWICISPTFENVLRNSQKLRKFVYCIGERSRNSSSGTSAPPMIIVESANFFGTVIHLLVPLAFVTVLCTSMFEVIRFTNWLKITQKKGRTANKSNSSSFSIFATVTISTVGGTLAATFHLMDSLQAETALNGSSKNLCKLMPLESMSLTRLYALLTVYALCTAACCLDKYFNSIKFCIFSKFFEAEGGQIKAKKTFKQSIKKFKASKVDTSSSTLFNCCVTSGSEGRERAAVWTIGEDELQRLEDEMRKTIN